MYRLMVTLLIFQLWASNSTNELILKFGNFQGQSLLVKETVVKKHIQSCSVFHQTHS